MPRHRSATPVPDVTKLDSGALIRRAEATALIAARVWPEVDQRHALDRARKRISYWIRKGKLSEEKPDYLRVPALGRMLHETWPEKFKDYVPRDLVIPLSGMAVTIGMPPRLQVMRGLILPSDLVGCQEEIRTLHAELTRMTCERDDALEKVKLLEAKAAVVRARRARASAAGKQGGRGRTK